MDIIALHCCCCAAAAAVLLLLLLLLLLLNSRQRSGLRAPSRHLHFLAPRATAVRLPQLHSHSVAQEEQGTAANHMLLRLL
jgi:hypothetical protein